MVAELQFTQSSAGNGPVWLLVGIPCVILLRVIADRMDRERIREYLEAKGGKVLDITWEPFGPGWFGSESERIYEVTFRMRKGAVLKATCKTSLFSGVYWTEGGPPASSLAEVVDSTAEEFACLQCGATVGAGHARCPHCGWSYKDK